MPKNNAMATYRAYMLPYAEFDDGSYGFWPANLDAYPQIAADTGNAMLKAGRIVWNMFDGPKVLPEEAFPTSQDGALLAGLAMTGPGFLAKPRGSVVSGKAPAQVEPLSPLTSHGVEAGSEPWVAQTAGPPTSPMRAYHGMKGPLKGGRFKRGYDDNSGLGPHFGTADQANNFAGFAGRWNRGSVVPVDLEMNNTLAMRDMLQWNAHDMAEELADVYPAKFSHLPETVKKAPDPKTALRSELIAQGYDGIRYWNADGSEGPGLSYMAFKPGTVKSATTGETLFSTAPDSAPAGLLPMAGDQPLYTPPSPYEGTQDRMHQLQNEMRKMRGLPPVGPFTVPAPQEGNEVAMNNASFDAALADLQGILVDLDGDGQPDARVPAPQQGGNAMAQYAQGGPVMTDAVSFEGAPSTVPATEQPSNAMASAGAQYGPPDPTVHMPVGDGDRKQRIVPGGNSPGNFMDRMRRIPLTAPLEFFGAAPQIGQIGRITGTAQTMGAAGPKAVKNAFREYSSAGKKANADESRALKNIHRAEDADVSRTPHWKLQGQDPVTKRWQKLPTEVKAARERGIEARRTDQKWREMEGKWWKRDENGEVYLTQDAIDYLDPPGGGFRKR